MDNHKNRGEAAVSVKEFTSWAAPWIWREGEPAPFHSFLFLRRSFDLTELPGSATLHITAADRYRLFVNGAYLGRGPSGAIRDGRRMTRTT